MEQKKFHQSNWWMENLNLKGDNMSTTTIRVSRETKEKLESLGAKTSTYDSIIHGLYCEHMIRVLVDESNRIMFDSDDLYKRVSFVFASVGYEIPSHFTDYDASGAPIRKEWSKDPLAWAIEMAQDEDFVGHNRTPQMAEIVVNCFCLLEEIPAPT